MDDKLRRYIDGLFKDVPQSKSMVELKEEMLQNLLEKYQDLMTEGKTEDAAFNIAIAGIGDVSSLIGDLNQNSITQVDRTAERQKTAALTSLAVMLYILSIVPLLFFVQGTVSLFNGVIGFFVVISVATGILIYNGMTKSKNYRSEGTMVEEFKEWQTSKSNRTLARVSVSIALWSILLALYFIISFSTFAWYVTWVIFVIGIAIEALINIFFIMKK